MALGYDFYASWVRSRERKLKKHSAQIGRLCTLWSTLEFDTTIFLTVLAPIDDPAVKNVLMGSMEFRDKLHAVVALGHKKRPNDDWYERLEALFKEIHERIRLERNRMVHDFWYSVPDKAGKEQINRVQIKPKVVKIQSRTKALQLSDMKPISAAEIAALCDKIIDANTKLLVLKNEFEQSPFRGRLPQPTPPPNPSPRRAKKAATNPPRSSQG